MWKPVELASLANALISEYAGATYGGRLWNDDVSTRFGATGTRLATPLRVDAGRIETVSYGEERPLAQGHDESAWSQNRRDEVEILAGGDVLKKP